MTSPIAIAIGVSVRVNSVQPHCLGKPRYPGRVGVVLNKNPFGGHGAGGLWYVKLAPTERAKERTSLFWGDHLTVIGEPGASREAPR